MFKQGKGFEEMQSDKGQTKNGGRRLSREVIPPPHAMATEVTQTCSGC